MDRKRITQLVNTVVEAEGFEVVKLHNHPKHTVRAWVDRDPDLGEPGGDPGGVGIEDCKRLIKAVREAISEEGEDPGDYQVEVQSPGLDRLLVRAKDFDRFAGKEVQATLKEKREGRRNFKGELLGLEDGEVVVKGPDEEEPWRFHRRDLKEVRLVPELPFAAFEPQKKPKRSRNPRKSRRKKPKQH